MDLQYKLPTSKLKDFIVHYEQVQSLDEEISMQDIHIPSGYTSFVFNLSGYARIEESPTIELPSCFIVPPLFRGIKIGIYGKFDSFIVSLYSSKFSRLFNTNLQPKKGQFILPLVDRDLNYIMYRLRNDRDVNKRIKLIESIITGRNIISNYEEDEVDLFYNSIIETQGRTPISELLSHFEHTPQSFRKKFVKRVGVTAKTLARIIRVNYLWSKIIKDKSVDFQDIVFDANYFDQPHFIHDFKHIVGETPRYFFKRNQEALRLISGKD